MVRVNVCNQEYLLCQDQQTKCKYHNGRLAPRDEPCVQTQNHVCLSAVVTESAWVAPGQCCSLGFFSPQKIATQQSHPAQPTQARHGGAHKSDCLHILWFSLNRYIFHFRFLPPCVGLWLPHLFVELQTVQWKWCFVLMHRYPTETLCLHLYS